MKQTVLIYNFEGERLKKLKTALLPLKVGIRLVDKAELLQPIGFLAGIKGFEPTDEKTEGGFEDEMLVMCGFDGKKLDDLIRALKKHGVGRVPLKAVLTPTNVSWNSVDLYNAVKEDYLSTESRGTKQ